MGNTPKRHGRNAWALFSRGRRNSSPTVCRDDHVVAATGHVLREDRREGKEGGRDAKEKEERRRRGIRDNSAIKSPSAVEGDTRRGEGDGEGEQGGHKGNKGRTLSPGDKIAERGRGGSGRRGARLRGRTGRRAQKYQHQGGRLRKKVYLCSRINSCTDTSRIYEMAKTNCQARQGEAAAQTLTDQKT